MDRLLWLTDIHLNFLQANGVEEFISSVGEEKPDAILIGGDIGEAPTFEGYLHQFERLEVPIYFVLGNHDFYRGAIHTVRARAAALTRESRFLKWLPEAGLVEINADTGLVGHDGWADGRYGNFETSGVILNDFFLIKELLEGGGPLTTINTLGDEAAAYLRTILPTALDRYRRVIVLTHVPPFQEAAWHEGKRSDEDWLPFFASRASGDALLEAARGRPDREILVLCGHCHGAGAVDVLPNLRVLTGGADYGKPVVERVIEPAKWEEAFPRAPERADTRS
ncbi:MAG TPA: metallophosphoesterase [Planctomycetota bacterium]|nr:metallophosphoesterase [Planctomycetota bacterium]